MQDLSQDGERFGYELVGRAISAWSRLDQEITRQTLLANDPERASPFFVGKVKSQFPERLIYWFSLVQPSCKIAEIDRLDEYRRSLLVVIDCRNDLAHHIFDIHGYSVGRFSIGFERLSIDWEQRFQRWSAQISSGTSRPMPAGRNEILRIGEDQVRRLVDIGVSAREFVELASEVHRRSSQFIPPAPVSDLPWSW